MGAPDVEACANPLVITMLTVHIPHIRLGTSAARSSSDNYMGTPGRWYFLGD